MTDEAKRMASVVRQYAGTDPIWAKIGNGRVHPLEYAADLIEELSVKLDECEIRIAGLEIMLTTAQSAAETWQHRAMAAERDMAHVSPCLTCTLRENCMGTIRCKTCASDPGDDWRMSNYAWRGPCPENGGV